MNTFPKIPVRAMVQALVVLVLLAIIFNPELRVLVLFVDSIGLELLVLLLTLQLRSAATLFGPLMEMLASFSCDVAGWCGSLALRAYQKALVLRRLDRVVCSMLVFVSYGLCCQVTRRAT